MTIFTTARSLVLALTLAGAAATQAGEINSDLQIEPGQTFELGGGQPGGFTVKGRNSGTVVVAVLGKRPDGQSVERGTVAPGGAVDARFAPGEMALLRNTSDVETARLRLVISGDTSSLGMTYSPNP
jgi:hypothetical protein